MPEVSGVIIKKPTDPDTAWELKLGLNSTGLTPKTKYKARLVGPEVDLETLQSTALSAPARVPNSPLPSISGNTTVGSTLTRATTGEFTGNPTPQKQALWADKRGAATEFTTITGQNGETYTADGATYDAGDQIRTGTRAYNSQGEIIVWSDPWTLTEQPALTATVTPIPLVAGQPAQIVFNEAPTSGPTATDATVVFTGGGTTWDFTVPADIEALTIGASKTGWKSFGFTFDVVAPDLGAFDLTSKNYPTAIGTITYDLKPQFSGTVTAWAVSGPGVATIPDGVLTLDSDSMSPGIAEYLITATGATNPKGRLRLTWEPITITFDGTNITSVTIPDDTPPDTEITYTPTGGVHNNRTITFKPSDLVGLADGEGFFALPPIVTITTDTGGQGTINQGDVLDLTAPALPIFTGTTVPTITYSARHNSGQIANNITFPYTVPAGLVGTFYIRASDGHGNFIDSAPTAVVEETVTFTSNFADPAYDTNPDLSASANYALVSGTTLDVNSENRVQLRTALGTTSFGIMRFVNLDGKPHYKVSATIGSLQSTDGAETISVYGRRTDGTSQVALSYRASGQLRMIISRAGVTETIDLVRAAVPGDVIELEIKATTATAILNGSPVATMTDKDISTLPVSGTVGAFGINQRSATTVKTTIIQVGYEVLP